MNGLT